MAEPAFVPAEEDWLSGALDYFNRMITICYVFLFDLFGFIEKLGFIL